MTHILHCGDLPEDVCCGPAIAVDTEAMGLNPQRDRLCLVQISAGDGDAHLIQFNPGDYAAPRLKHLLAAPDVTKIFHFARFDLGMLYRYLGVMATPVYCTKI
ncbi:MAG: ribonuclease D, partial [Alphaproteobacteria bacterium]|nr:ribonuclease D [Alphaproteobacteria bacterium]